MKQKTLKILLAVTAALLVGVLLVQVLYASGVFKEKTAQDAVRRNEAETVEPAETEALSGMPLHREGYTLEQVVILSRHNIRSPMSGKGSALDTLTPHEWFSWSSNPSQLSIRGGVLETEMGQYFRKWMESEGLIPENWLPEDGAVRIYANSKQRTLATAKFFCAGLFPAADTEIEHHGEFDTMDPVFTPQLTFMTDQYRQDMIEEINERFADDIAELADNYRLIEDVIDIRESEDWKDGKTTGFLTDDSEFVLNENAEPGVKGSLKTACSVSDALVLQYYEADDEHAAFGKTLTQEQWKEISAVKDLYGDVLFTAPDIAVNVAHPLLQEIYNELMTPGRKFTFLCGHDSNVGSVLAALGVADYELPEAIESKTPIGCKVVFCRWSDAAGKSYITVDLVYQSVDQLRGMPLLDLAHPPVVYELAFTGILYDADGLCPAEKMEERLKSAIDRYDELLEQYVFSEAA